MQIFDHSLDFERRSALASIKTPKIILERWHDPKTDKKGASFSAKRWYVRLFNIYNIWNLSAIFIYKILLQKFK